jgi:hypothetical protein
MKKVCSGHLPVTRRHLLFGSAFSGAGARFLHAHSDAEQTAAGAPLRNTARACIFINLNGGPSHLDLFNPQDGPWNPSDADIRGYAGGIRLSNRFYPNLSRLTSELLVLRSVAAWENAHERGQYYMQTAHSQNPAFASETPHIGAVISRERGANGVVPPFLSFNQSNLQGAAFLGGRFQPLMPPVVNSGIPTLVHNHFGTPDQSRARFEQRFELLETLDAPLRNTPYNLDMADYASFYAQARNMMYNDTVGRVFQFTQEEEQRYGNSVFGRSLIIARNAVQANNGATFINVTMDGWDTHDNMFSGQNPFSFYRLGNEMDRGVASLVTDLRASGDLARTLIVIMGEFGRTPGNLNTRGGRDHHKDAMCAAMIGGGVKGGRAIGNTDVTGARITDPGWAANRPMYPEDIAATIYSALGIDYTKVLLDTPSGRRFQLIPGAAEGHYQPIEEVWG